MPLDGADHILNANHVQTLWDGAVCPYGYREFAKMLVFLITVA